MPDFDAYPRASALNPTDRLLVRQTNGDGSVTTRLVTGAQVGGAAAPVTGTLSITGMRSITGTWPLNLGINQEITLTGTPSGAGFLGADGADKYPLNLMAVIDNVVGPVDGTAVVGLQLNHVYGDGAGVTSGQRIGLLSNTGLVGTIQGDASTQLVGAYFAHNAFGNVSGSTSGSPLGGFFAGDFQANLGSGVFAYEHAGLEIDMGRAAGSVARYTQGLNIIYSIPNGVVPSISGTDAYIRMGAAAVGLQYGIFFGEGQGGGAFPVSASGTLIYSVAGTATHGIDLSLTTLTGDLIKGPSSNFVIDGSGNVHAHSYGSSSAGNANLTISSAGTGGILFTSTDGILFEVGNANPGTGMTSVPTINGGVGFISLTAPGATNGSIYIEPNGTGVVLFGGAGLVQIDPTAGSVFAGEYIVGTSGPTIISGNGAPSATQPNGSLYLRKDGSASTRLYVSEGGGTWSAIASS